MRPERGTVQVETVTSKLLEGNLPGDPNVRDLWIYTPPGYEKGSERYPVIWCLAGFTGRGRSFLNDGAWTPALNERMDALIGSGRCKPAILALPDCFTHLGGSQYVNSEGLGAYEDHIVEELVPHVDAKYRTLGFGHRGVMGKSSGGYGSMSLGMRQPDVFSAIACHSGDMGFDWCYPRDFGPAARRIRKFGGVAGWMKQFAAQPKKREADFPALDTIAMAAAYSPNPENAPAFCDLPFDWETGEPQPHVWARWIERDPLTLVDHHVRALREMKLVFFDCGTEDEFYLELGARQMAKKLTALGVKHEYQEFEDGHMNIPYRYDVSLPKLTAALSA
ncbi:MAG TPA: alpha/beta hydrolase-fold protein [Candidatus Omnitrophota bacterium]|jgi:enterochelin esterase family protein|nr:alpha/beta hydrolase-fold protein [Candidatus Omnitrophota bacterium]